MTTMKKMIGSALLGATVIGGLATIGAGTAAAEPNPAQPGAGQAAKTTTPAPRPNAKQTPNRVPQQAAPRPNGQNPNWRPGPVYRQGGWHTPIWDKGRNHWGFWLGPVWIPVG